MNELKDGHQSLGARLRKVLAPIDHRAHESKQFKMLLSESELTSHGLTFAGEQAWTIGNRGFAGPEIERAREQGHLNVWRRFANKSAKTSMWIQLGEFSSAPDAATFAPTLFESILQRPGDGTEMIEVSETIEVPGLSSTMIGDERSPYQDGFRRTRVVVGTVDQWLFSSGFSSTGDVWSWSDIEAIVSNQVQRIRTK